MLEHVDVGFEGGFNRAGVQPDIHFFGAHLRAMFEHDVDGIGQEIFALELYIALDLLIDGGHQRFTLFEVVAANQHQVVFHALGFFDQAGNAPGPVHFGHPEPARIGNRLDPGDSVHGFVGDKAEIGFNQCIRKNHDGWPVQRVARQPERVRLAFHFFLDNIAGFNVGVILLDINRNLFAQVRPDDENVLHLHIGGQAVEHVHQVIERSTPGHADQRLGLAPGMRAHTRAPTGHRNNDFQGLGQGVLQ